MLEPVFTPSGFTYSRPALQQYIAAWGRDPAQHGAPLSPHQLVINLNLRDQLVSWLKQQGVQM